MRAPGEQPRMRGPVTWSTAETAAYLRVSKDTVLAMIRRGELAAVKIGSLWRVHTASIGRLLGADTPEARRMAITEPPELR